MRIIFAGTPAFAVPALQALLNQKQHEIVLALTQPDRPKGRGMQVQASAVKQLAQHAGLAIAQPQTLKHTDIQAHLQSLQADLGIVVAYGLLLPQTVLQSTRLGWWNIHASLLPRWRGAAPIQRALEAGDKQTGVCLMQMQLGLDTGAFAFCEKIDIHAGTSAGELSHHLANLGAQQLLEALQSPETIDWQVQAQEGVNYAHKIQKTESLLQFENTAQVLTQKIMAFNPAPVAYTFFRGERIKVWHAHAVNHVPKAIQNAATQALGAMMSLHEGAIVVRCAEGFLAITQLQKAGANAMDAPTFWQRYQVKSGEIFDMGDANALLA